MNHVEANVVFSRCLHSAQGKTHGEISCDVSGLMAAVIWKQILARINYLSSARKCIPESRILVDRL